MANNISISLVCLLVSVPAPVVVARSPEDEAVRHRNAMLLEIGGYLSQKYKKYPPLNDEACSLQALQQYLRRRNTGMSKTRASLETAIGLGKGVRYSRRILFWADQWATNEELVLSRRGKHVKTRNQLNDNDNFSELRTWIIDNHKYTITPQLLQRHVNTTLLPALGIPHSICESTALRWLRALGWIYSRAKKGLYFDGHERPDVVEYRTVFLARMEVLEKRMVIIDKDDQTKVIEPTLVCISWGAILI